MRKLVVTKKTGYDVNNVNVPINIRDERGILFYSTESLVPKVIKFNLPPGTYFVDSGVFKEAATPRNYPPINLPSRQRYFYPDPKQFKILFAPNPDKCTVSWTDKTITFDTSFLNRPIPQLDVIMFHEFGHRFYKTERYCDIYAAHHMLKEGYNPSQIGLAVIDSLSDRQDERKEFVIDSFN